MTTNLVPTARCNTIDHVLRLQTATVVVAVVVIVATIVSAVDT